MPFLGVGYDVWYTPKQVNKGMYGSQARRRSMYAQRGTAARRIQTSYRRYRSATAGSDQRQLSSIVRSHRKANPYQITPSSGRTVTFWRKCSRSIPLSQSAGFDGIGNNVNFGFSLGNVLWFNNGAFQTPVAVSNAAEFQALFDYYCIKSVKIQMFYTRNSMDSGTLGMPILVVANDFDDIGETMTLNSMNERVGARTVQFENTGTKGITHYIKPKSSNVVVQMNVVTGVLSSANAGIPFGTEWIDTAQSNIVHNGFKVVYDNQGLTSATVLGNVTFVFDIEYCFKGYR